MIYLEGAAMIPASRHNEAGQTRDAALPPAYAQMAFAAGLLYHAAAKPFQHALCPARC